DICEGQANGKQEQKKQKTAAFHHQFRTPRHGTLSKVFSSMAIRLFHQRNCQAVFDLAKFFALHFPKWLSAFAFFGGPMVSSRTSIISNFSTGGLFDG
ncbi:MAG TPA: hypothetical protein VGB07_21720, partial [Blastocatellia bacterium]